MNLTDTIIANFQKEDILKLLPLTHPCDSLWSQRHYLTSPIWCSDDSQKIAEEGAARVIVKAAVAYLKGRVFYEANRKFIEDPARVFTFGLLYGGFHAPHHCDQSLRLHDPCPFRFHEVNGNPINPHEIVKTLETSYVRASKEWLDAKYEGFLVGAPQEPNGAHLRVSYETEDVPSPDECSTRKWRRHRMTYQVSYAMAPERVTCFIFERDRGDV